MTKAVTQELASGPITVNAVAPGFMTSAMTDAFNDRQRDAILSRIPAGAMGKDDDIAAAVIYLAAVRHPASPARHCSSTAAWQCREALAALVAP